jgi:hypothetical protein
MIHYSSCVKHSGISLVTQSANASPTKVPYIWGLLQRGRAAEALRSASDDSD